MPIECNPKKMAEDVSHGLISFNKAVLKKYTPVDLKVIHSNLQVVLREVRAQFVELTNFEAVKEKNIRMQRLNQAIMMLSNYCKLYRVQL
jgi:hypothetical protein